MRLPTILPAAAAAVTAAVLLSACSSAPQSGSAGLLPGGLLPTGASPAKAAVPRKLYVTDNSNNDVALFSYGTWTSLGSITNGVGNPYGDWVDKTGNLYVANRPKTAAPNITEYDPSGNVEFTYTAGMIDPVSVTTDKAGNVYEADETGTVTEYAQGSNVAAATCSLGPGNAVLGVAIDKRNDVFVTYRSSGSTGNNGGRIVVFPGGLNRGRFACTNALLPITLGTPVGAAFDKQGNLLVCDATTPAVDIIAPPYKSITGTLGSGWVTPFFVTIDKTGTQAYVTDPSADTVTVLAYPSGTVVTTLGKANGLAEPVSAVDSKNYVP